MKWVNRNWVNRSSLLISVLFLCHLSTLAMAKTIKLSEVENGIFVFQGVPEQMSVANLGAISNSGFIVGERSVAVIDPGGSLEFGLQLRQAIEAVTDLPIEYLLLTHFHPDHVAGSAAFPEVKQIIAHKNYARAITQRAQFYIDRFNGLLKGKVVDVFLSPTREVLPGQAVEVDLGGRNLSIEAHPVAHTDNDMTIHDQQTNTFWASDLIFDTRTPSLDGSLIGWLNVLSILDERKFGLTIPGHGTPAPWSELLPPQKTYLTRLRDDVRAMIDSGMALSAVLKKHDEEKSKNSPWALHAAQHGSNLAKAYSELEWE